MLIQSTLNAPLYLRRQVVTLKIGGVERIKQNKKLIMKTLQAIGLMSGTSMDGIDAALLTTDGETIIKEQAYTSLAYEPEMHLLLKAAEFAINAEAGDLSIAKENFSAQLQLYLTEVLNIQRPKNLIKALRDYLYNDSQLSSVTQINLIDIIHKSTQLHRDVVNKLLTEAESERNSIDVIGYHGQTFYHNPRAKISIQAGDGVWLADNLNMTVVNNFRENDISHGGEGAPLAPIYHYGLIHRDQLTPALVINCGGIANITAIKNQNPEEIIAFDCGPGNALLDSFIRYKTSGKENMDRDGQYGLKGKTNQEILHLLQERSCQISTELNNKNYYEMKTPKSLDINNLVLLPEIKALSIEDGAANLAAFTSMIIAKSIKQLDYKFEHCVLAGGGWSNPVILEQFKKYCEAFDLGTLNIKHADAIGWQSQALEAQCFAYLAVRSLKDLPISFPGTTNIIKPLAGGSIHKPNMLQSSKIAN